MEPESSDIVLGPKLEEDSLQQKKGEVMEMTKEVAEEKKESDGPEAEESRVGLQASDASSQAVVSSYMSAPLPESVSGKISKACALKQEGNEFFKDGKWKKAMRKYHYALMYVNGVVDRVDNFPGLVGKLRKVKVTAEEEKTAGDLISTLSNNLAACFLKTGEWEKVVVHTNKVLGDCPGNAKALFRRGVAFMNLSKFEEAKNDLKAAEKLDPDDLGIKKHLHALQKRMKDYEKQEQKLYASMFQTS